MRIENLKLENYKMSYPLDKIAPLEEILFIDIETTGFAAQSSSLYLIGAAYYQAGYWCLKQWFAEEYEEEKQLLDAFFAFAAPYSHLVHFNGNNFDLPYLLQKCTQYELPYNFDDFEGIDLYKRISPYKFFLNTPNCKQKTLETFLGVDRRDMYNGGQLINIYHKYVKRPTEFNYQLLLLHNSDDMKGMLQLTSLLAYYDLFNGKLRAKKVQANTYEDMDGVERHVLLMKLELPQTLPRPISAISNGCCFNGEEKEGVLKVPLYQEEMKYFYSNYKDYYYLPAEDAAMHKSVASFVDKDHRVQASAATCYTRKFSTYLPQWDVQVEPFFKRTYQSRELFFELTDERKKDRALFSVYAGYILQKMLNA
ncbi:MAG: ribonuclease H-like domain-containing protein [Clostridium sp.]|nr:ribonuclease H-like domain-containing protein [Lachnospiraceae bacterium]MCM1252876.1 ribonuclease H-like domain-containing protein [Clostridium sp.]